MALQAYDLALGQPLRKSVAAGGLTWLAASLVAAVSLSGAIAAADGRLFWAAAACTLTATIFALRPDAGLVLVMLARPVLDVWADRSITTAAGLRLNIASLTAITVIVVGGAFVVERWATVRSAPAITPFLVFAGIAGASIALAPWDGAAVYEWLRLVSLLVLYGVCYVVARALAAPGRLAAAIIASAAIPVAVAVYQVAEGGVRSIADFGRATGTFLHPVPFGIFLALVIAFAVPLLLLPTLRSRWAVRLAAPLALAALIGTYTRTAWIGLAVGFLVVALLRHRVLLALAPLLVLAIAVAVPSAVTRSTNLDSQASSPREAGNSLDSRLSQWRTNLPKIQRDPLSGEGLSAIAESQQGVRVHSDYVRAGVETGVFGLAAYLWLMFATLRGSYGAMRGALRAGHALAYAIALGSLAASLAFVVMSATSNLMTQVVVAGTFWCIAAVGHAARPSEGRVAA